jgi:hypothetical protein
MFKTVTKQYGNKYLSIKVSNTATYLLSGGKRFRFKELPRLTFRVSLQSVRENSRSPFRFSQFIRPNMTSTSDKLLSYKIRIPQIEGSLNALFNVASLGMQRATLRGQQ